MAHGYPAGEGAKAGLGKDVRHQAHALVLVHAVRIQGNDARALLAPVLLGVEAEIGQTGRVLMIINTEKTAFVPNHNHLLLQFFAQMRNAIIHDRRIGIFVARQLKLFHKKVNKPVMIDFSGFGCVNCRKMEASVWTDPKVKQMLENDYVLITLMVDDKTKLPQPIEIQENGKTRKLKTIGDKWSYLQRSKFGSNAQPFYILLNDEGQPLGPSYAFNEDVSKYIQFLQNGLKEFKKEQQ